MHILDIIIPTYEYPEGLRRILNSMPEDNKVRLIISDDSLSGDIKKVANEFTERLNIKIISGPRQGAVENWNFALGYVEAQYAIFLHHDEEIFGLTSLLELLKSKIERSERDTIVLPSRIQNSNGKWRAHSTKLLQFSLRYFRKQLSMHNFIGATACLVVHRENLVPFNATLKWLVDCEWYDRILRNYSFVSPVNDIFINSYHYPGSITWSVGSDVKTLFWRELKILGKATVFDLIVVVISKITLRIIFYKNWQYK